MLAGRSIETTISTRLMTPHSQELQGLHELSACIGFFDDARAAVSKKREFLHLFRKGRNQHREIGVQLADFSAQPLPRRFP